jgi:hypothetical protein
MLGPDKPETLESMNNLGETLQSEGHYAEAEKLQRKTHIVVSRVFAPTHPNTLSVMTDLAVLCKKKATTPQQKNASVKSSIRCLRSSAQPHRKPWMPCKRWRFV